MKKISSLVLLIAIGFGAFAQQFTNQIVNGLPLNIQDYSVSAEDFNGDGAIDLIYAVTDNDYYQFFKNNKNGTFTNVSQTMGISISKNWWFKFVDLDKDGLKDILVENNIDSSLNLYKNINNISYTNTTTRIKTPKSMKINASSLMDFDKDGDMDIIISPTPLEKSIKVLQNRKVGNDIVMDSIKVIYDFSSTFAGNEMPIFNASADFDNDGDEDILFKRFCRNCGAIGDGNYYAHPHGLLLNNGKGNFSDFTAASGLGNIPGAGIWDYNNDGNFDLISGTPDLVTNYSGAQIQVWQGNGNGTFTDKTITTQLYDGARRYYKWFGAYDIDNDFDLDAYAEIAGYGDTQHKLYRNNGGNNAFTDIAQQMGLNFSGGFDHSGGHLWTDYDLDGDKDLFQIENSALKVYKNNIINKNWIKIKLHGC